MSERMRRVNESVRAVVAETVGTLKDPRIGLVTVTGVRLTPDLREGTVFVSVLGNEKKRRATLAGLDSARGVVQGRVGRELGLKRTPLLTFEYDDAVERGVRMTALIDQLASELPPPEDDGPADGELTPEGELSRQDELSRPGELPTERELAPGKVEDEHRDGE